MMLFDFSAYIASLLSLPQEQISIQVLAGGYTNVTVRATFAPPVHLSKLGHSQSFDSIVLKYAPPFLATDPTQTLSVQRQVIEAGALDLLSGSAISAIAAVLAKFPNLRIPKLIHHDKDRSVLWITDLGNTLTLFDYLSSDPSAQDIGQIAAALGEFLAEFYSATRNPSPETLSYIYPNSSAEAHSLLVSAVIKVLTEAGISDAELLTERVARSLRDSGNVEPCLGMVDFWPGSILIDANGNCGLVDWEYFGLSSASSELGMLAAHLHMVLLKTKSTTNAVRNTQLFIITLLQSYAKHAPPPSQYFKRQALVSHGRELVNTLAFQEAELDDATKERALAAGIKSLRAAGDSENDVNLSLLADTDDRYEFIHEGLLALLYPTRQL